MITEVVNGELRQVFTLGGFRYYAPVKLGAGYRKQLESNMGLAAISSDSLMQTMSHLMRTRKKPNGLPEEEWRQQLVSEALPIVMSTMELKGADVQELALLEALLTPAPDSPPVKKAYYEDATESEVQAVVNFSKAHVGDKTSDEVQAPHSGTDSKAKPEGRSRTTSRKHTKV